MKDYKKILEGVVNIISTTEENDIVSNICSYIDENCPELIESEDEKIKKDLIKWFKDFPDDVPWKGHYIVDILAWLEKQGEPKAEPTFLFKVKRDGKEYNVRGIFGDVSLELYDESESNPNHFIYASLDNCEIIKGGYGIKESGSPYPTEPATFSEQKPVNKAEPEFRPGDWVVCEDDCSVHQIKSCFENLNSHTYDYELTEGGHISGDNINKWHLWTFEDAKDTDTLIDKDDQPFIFNGHFTSQTINGYCGLVSGTFISGVHLWIQNVKPATREQRNRLEKAMKEAGWTFDFKRGGLIKITKFQVGDWVVEPREDESDVLWHIEKIENGSYWDGSVGASIEYADKYYYAWTLENDAKDGEILVSSITNKPFIYNGKFNENHVGAYCGIGYDDEFVIARTQYYWTEKKDIVPATKEQRDFLFEIMKDAGYEWDFSNKKPVKIETK